MVRRISEARDGDFERSSCHCEARSAEAISGVTSAPELFGQEIASALRASQ
jgi:hypothetical protein